MRILITFDYYACCICACAFSVAQAAPTGLWLQLWQLPSPGAWELSAVGRQDGLYTVARPHHVMIIITTIITVVCTHTYLYIYIYK